ncbi:hypothetical protein JTB14_026152 [Gonioctena quinquepunctata]|nr:hypothetical protein JTB14_026152 [Gonioctena quinquepunctata]
MMIQQVQMKIKSLQNPSPDAVNLLKNIYDTPPSSQSGVFSGNIFNSPNTTSLNQQGTGFGAQAPQGPSIFAQANQSMFGNTQQQQTSSQGSFGTAGIGIFGNTNQKSIFGGQTTNVFGTSQTAPQTATSNIFGKSNFSFASSGNSVFASQPSPQQSEGSIFGGNANSTLTSQAQVQQSIFVNQNVFGQSVPQAGSIFGSTAAPEQAQTSIFGSSQATVQNPQGVGQMVQEQQASANVFGNIKPQTSASIFGQQMANNQGFSGTPNPPFGQAKPDIAASSSIFGGPNTVANSTFSSVQPDESLYSKLEDLTQEEIKWFESDDLDILKIPEKPPTYQMCFKT